MYSRLVCMACRGLYKAFPHLKEWCEYWSLGITLFSWIRSGRGWEVVERYIQNQEKPNAKSPCSGPVLKSGV